MEIFFTYLFKSSLLIALFWCCSQFFLQRETFFQQHRLFLLFGIFTAIMFPFVVITKIVYVQPVLLTGPFENISSGTVSTGTNYINWWAVLLVSYLIGVFCMLVHFCIQLFSLRRLITNSVRFKKGRFSFVETSEHISPFSFFNYIVYNPSLYTPQELETILAHEQVHSYQKHSLDIILVHLLRIFQWMNPFIWGYKKLMSQNLEYLADHEVGNANYDKKEYQYLLLRQSVTPLQVSSLGNPFFNSLIKKRIVMLNKNKSNKGKLFKFSIIIPLLALFLFTINTKTIAQTITIESNYDTGSDADSFSSNTVTTSAIYSLTIDKNSSDEELDKEKIQFKKDGIDLKFYSISRNNAGEIIAVSSSFKGPEGSTGQYSASGSGPIKSFNFYIKSDGQENIQEIGYSVDAPDSHNAHFDHHEQHLKATGKFTEKTKKHLDNHKKAVLKNNTHEEDSTIEINGTAYTQTSVSHSSNGDTKIRIRAQDQEKDPIYVINGKVVKKEKIHNIPTYQIVSVNVLKGTNAKNKYGDKGKDGVVELTIDTSRTKKDSKDSITVEDIIKIESDNGVKPLFIVDGKKMKKDFKAEELDTDNIKSMFVLKGKEAKKKYGKEGKNGVVIITSKNKK